jgi:outer membrane protein assembly factor BamB
MRMKKSNWMAGVLFAFLLCGHAAAVPPANGWRGDSSGKYPDADPPVSWSHVSAQVKHLRFTTDTPVGPESGTAMPDGVVREWLIAGPLPLAKAGTDDASALPDEASLAPRAGEEAGGVKWQKVTLDSAYLNFAALFKKSPDADTAALAFARVYSEAGGPFRLAITSVGRFQVYLNGKKSAASGDRRNIDLAKGWNTLLLRVSPGESDWYAVAVFQGRGKCDYEQSGIAWRLPLPGPHPAFYGGGQGVGSPVIVGDKIFVTSDPGDLICIEKKSGKVLWLRRAGFFETATDEEKKKPAYAEAAAIAARIDVMNTSFVAGTATAEQLQEKLRIEKELRKKMATVDEERYAMQEIPDVGFAGFTPCSDGRNIYAWFGNGVSACFGLDGERRWVRADPRTAVEHGFSSSPLVIDGKFVVFMRDLMAFDCETEKIVWQTPLVEADGLNPGAFFHGTPIGAHIGGVGVVVLPTGGIVRASDGKVLFKDEGEFKQAVASPVIDGGQLFLLSSGSMEFFIRPIPKEMIEPLGFSTRIVSVGTAAFPKHYMHWHLSSPLVHDGLAYMVNNGGVLTVVDVEAGKVLYQRLLDLDVFQAHNEGSARGVGASLTLGGKHLYVQGNNGAVLVLEPGREYRQIAKNKIEQVVLADHWAERQERFMANPVADGKRLYLRGEESLYAIEP